MVGVGQDGRQRATCVRFFSSLSEMTLNFEKNFGTGPSAHLPSARLSSVVSVWKHDRDRSAFCPGVRWHLVVVSVRLCRSFGFPVLMARRHRGSGPVAVENTLNLGFRCFLTAWLRPHECMCVSVSVSVSERETHFWSYNT